MIKESESIFGDELSECFKQNISNFCYPQHDNHPQDVEGLGLEVLLRQQQWGDGKLPALKTTGCEDQGSQFNPIQSHKVMVL